LFAEYEFLLLLNISCGDPKNRKDECLREQYAIFGSPVFPLSL